MNPDISIDKNLPETIPGLNRFYHEAMATSFDIFVLHPDKTYAGQAALDAFRLLDELEAKLSRFIENSDISRLNNLPANKSLKIGLETFESLQLCAKLYEQTQGAFDVTVGLLVDRWLQQTMMEENSIPTGMDLVKLDKRRHTVELLADSVKIDLGGIGKGFAIDKMAEKLLDWDISTALISCNSTVLALKSLPGRSGWPVTLSNPKSGKILAHLELQQQAVGASGLQKGQHIIDPRNSLPVSGKVAAWAAAADAAAADALSTAFMIMSPEEIENYCTVNTKTSALVILEQAENDVLCFGRWKEKLSLSNS